ncbi:CRISPR-associated protein Cas4 [Persicitalea sp.]|uniref:CRISPR-associated protein Cas4 n=1 Tax=Persicitalea sp. TaxID=3100273 RepID=UPI0035944838
METAPKSSPRIGGMLVGYHRLCPRKAWWSLRGIWMEQESDTVALGRLLDQAAYARADKHLQVEAEAPDGTPLIGKIDRANLREGVLHETKKGRSCEDAHRWQVRFYLWLLHRNGVARADGSPFVGQLDYPLLHRTETVTLEAEHLAELERTVAAVRQLATQETPPPVLTKRSFCKKCAFEELCYG